MKDLNFEGELNFDEFPPVSTEEWEEVIRKDLKGENYKETLKWDTGEGIEPLPFYRSQDLENLEHSASPLSSTPNWSILEIIEDTDPVVANERSLHALENGASGLDIRLSAERISSKKDLEDLFEKVQLEIIKVVFGPSISSPQVIKWMDEIISDRDLNADSLDIHYSADILGYAALTGKLPERERLNDTSKLITTGTGYLMVDISPFANSGATLVQQLAFALAAGNEYLGTSIDKQLSLSFRFSTGTLYFPEIAKYRAFRLLWKRILEEYDFKPNTINLLSETALWNKSQNDSHNNMLRTTSEAMSSALGGCNGISIHRFDEHFSEHTPFASRIARNTQIILQEEAYLSKVTDPGAGSYYIEVLTENIAKESWKLFQKIENHGGFYEGLKSGFIQDMVSDSRKKKVQAYKEENELLIGVNKYQPDEEAKLISHKFQMTALPDLMNDQATKIKPLKPLYLEAELKKGDA